MSAAVEAFTRAPRAWTVGPMVLRILPKVALGVALVASDPAAALRRTPVTLLVPDAPTAQALRTALGTRASALGVWLRIRNGAPGGAAGADLVLAPDTELAAGCRTGALRPLDDGGRCGVPGAPARIVLGWDETRDAGSPGWRDFWELARLPGRRGLPARAAGTLEIALLADGVAANDVYRVLGTEAGAARAFRRLDQLRPYAVWWTDGGEALHVLRSGAVLMTAAPAATLAAAARQDRAIGVQWEDSLVLRTSWAIPSGATHVAAARRVLALLRERRVAAALDATEAAGPQAAGLAVDDAFWAAHPALVARFGQWLARR